MMNAAIPPVTVVPLGTDPLAAAGDPALIAIREELGTALEAEVPRTAVIPASTAGLAADTDVIIRHADSAAFDAASPDGQAATGALARVTALLARQPGGIDFAGRHWCTGRPCGRHPEAAAPGEAARPRDPVTRYLRKTTGSYYTPPELIHELLRTTLVPLLSEALTADGGTRARPLTSAGGGTYYTAPQAVPASPEEALWTLTACDPACGAGAFLVAAARLIAWYTAMYRAGRDGSIAAELPGARREVITRLIHGVDVSPLAVDVTRLALAAEALVPGQPNPYLAHHVKCGNALVGATPALLARGIPDAAYKPLPGDDPGLATAARLRNKAEREAWLTGRPTGKARRAPRPLAAMARAGTWTSVEQAHRELEASPGVRLAKRVADAWCAAFMWPHVPGGPDPVTTGALLHLAAGGRLAPEAEDTLAMLARDHRFFHWHLEFPGIFRPPGHGEPAPRAGAA